MSLAKTCRMTLHYITTTHLHLCSGKRQPLPNVSNFYSASVSYRYFSGMFLSHPPWLFCFSTLFVCPSLKLYNQPLLLQVSSGYMIPSVIPLIPSPAFVAVSLVPRGCHLVSYWTHLCFPCFWFTAFPYLSMFFSGLCLTSLHFLSHYKGTLTLSI